MQLQRRGRAVFSTIIVLGSSVLLFSVVDKHTKSTAPDQLEHIQQIETDTVELPGSAGSAPLRLSLEQLMHAYNVPGISIALIDDYQIVWAKGYGVVEPGSDKQVTTRTLYQAGSISKPVAATGALALVEQGKLSLDEDVNKKLTSWKVPENNFTTTEKVTLRRIMSHTAGLTVHGFPGYDVDESLPTLIQIFNGEKPANTPPIRVDFQPGSMSRYSGGGVTIEQQLMMDVTGKPFPALMRELVLDKIGMSDSSYEQPLPPKRAAMTAGGAGMDGSEIHGRWHIYPEMAAAGLWTTPTDLAKFGIEIALSKQGKSNRVLSQKMVNEMLTPAPKAKENEGLGFFLDRNTPGQFSHGGSDAGFQALFTMNADTGKGAVIMADSDNGNALEGVLLHKIAQEYGWTYKPPREESWDHLYLIALVKGTPAALREYDDLKGQTSPDYKVDENTLNVFGYFLLNSAKPTDAVEVFKRNVEEYPKSWNVYDSLGEAYMKTGQKDLAIQNYEKSLEINPNNSNAAEHLKKLKGQ
jgi:CubicO group peptidase (beta-lactamase class C family)